MQFSKIKHSAERFLASSVQGRVEIRAAVYRKGHDQPSRTWLTFDGEQIISADDIVYERMKNVRYQLIRHKLPPLPLMFNRQLFQSDWFKQSHKTMRQLEYQLYEEGIFDSYAVQQALIQYPNLSINQALQHEQPFIRAFALLDRRNGKRRLQNRTNFSTAFEALCYKIRMHAERDAEYEVK